MTSPEVAVGYSLFGGLVYLTFTILRRTREIDKRRDLLTEAERELSAAREQFATLERARLEAEIERLQTEMWKIRYALDSRLSAENHDEHP